MGDHLLFDLKYDPSIIEIPVPRYFREDDRIQVNLAFKEAVEKDGAKKKKKKGGKKKKKKKKSREEVLRLDRRIHPRLSLHLPADVDLQAGVRRVRPIHRPQEVLLNNPSS